MCVMDEYLMLFIDPKKFSCQTLVAINNNSLLE